ncbi:TetR/AcrR family transcriptional regulator [Ureibacillus sinduriensis]|uniref:TetR family transcriptional regulator n=1 Tax=Ureibacillus sinduriensis BLB-1 = JCM 15800 TaxID=1384057 RepID=A0A0A3HPC3_9BACL|nr:TetR/AcrR family transcriptional regulator [Ureibacillus sinduriensis]KGR74234.1 TetR family transcriptional regulator [Ureibacillus sinduriensis BLB-1 = JCM 15800]
MKERILDASRRAFEKKGFRFTMGELARHLRVSTKTLYGYYPSKDQLIGDILTDAIDKLKLKEKETLHNPSLDNIEKLRKCLILVPAEFQFAQLSHLEELQRYYPKQWEMLDQFINEQWTGIVALINEGILSGTIRPFNTETFIDLYIGGLYRLMENSSRNENRSTLLETLKEMVDILLVGILEKEG